MKQLNTTNKPLLKPTVKLLMLALIMSELNTPILISTALATDTATTIKCTDVIKACDKVLAAKDLAIKARDAQLGDYARLTKDQADQISRDKAWFKSPYLWLAVGFGVGVYVMKK